MIIILFGVSGIGKTTVGSLLAEDLGCLFYDADDFHPQSNIEKMKIGVSLNDDDRQDWLQTLRALINQSIIKGENAVLACSALKVKYREYLTVNDNVQFVLLKADFATIEERMNNREGHFGVFCPIPRNGSISNC